MQVRAMGESNGLQISTTQSLSVFKHPAKNLAHVAWSIARYEVIPPSALANPALTAQFSSAVGCV